MLSYFVIFYCCYTKQNTKRSKKQTNENKIYEKNPRSIINT